MDTERTYAAFLGGTRVATGNLAEMLAALKQRFENYGGDMPLVFEEQTGRQVDFDLRGTLNEAIERATPDGQPRGGRGRPRLGVVPREVSLLPRHWDWLEEQPSGASAAIRRLIDEKRRRDPEGPSARQRAEAVNRFLTAVAGNYPGYEEATRALWAGDRERFDQLMRHWPDDVRSQALRMLDLVPAAEPV